MTEPGSIVESAAAAAEAVLGQAEAPASTCCAAGLTAFAESEAYFTGEFNLAFAELAEAQATLAAEAESSLNGWIAAESAIQAIPPNNPNYASIVIRTVLAQANATESAFNASEAELAFQITSAEDVMILAEQFLATEAAVFSREAGCTELTSTT